MSDARLTRITRPSNAPLSPALRRVRGHAPAYLLARQALSPGEAVAYKPRDTLDRAELRRLISRGIVRQNARGCWLDLAAYHAAAARRSRRAMAIALPVSLALALLAMLFYR